MEPKSGVVVKYELRDRDGKLNARGTFEYCERRLTELRGTLGDTHTILPYEIEDFSNGT